MHNAEDKFFALLLEMAEAFGHKMSDGAIVAYSKHLKGYPLEAIEGAIYSAIEQETKFPPVAVFKKKHLNKRKNLKIDEEAKRQARYVKGYFESSQEPVYHDAITYEVMTTHLPFSDWKSRSLEDINKFFTAMFVKAYKEIADDEMAFKDAQKKLAGKEETKGVSVEDYTTPLMRENRAFVEEMERKTGEVFIRYHLHPWGIRQGWYAKGKALMFEDEDFKEQCMNSEDFNKYYPRSIAYMKGEPPETWPKLKLEPEPRILSPDEVSELLKPVFKSLDRLKGSRINSNGREMA